MGRRAVNTLTEEMAKEAYARHGNASKAARELHVSVNRVYNMLVNIGVIKPVKSSKAKQDYADASRRSYNDIDRDLHLVPGVKVATPKGMRTIFKVYPYHVATKSRYGNIECFTKGTLLSCATAKAEGKDYRDKEDEEWI